MALWHRIGSTRFECLSYQCKRWYSLFPGATAASVADLADWRWRFGVLEKPTGGPLARTSPSFQYASVRSFAAPVQAKPKPESRAPGGPRINGAITSAYVRIVTEEGHGIVSRREALDRARKLNQDLVEVQRTANPPVCKIMDFHKEKFKQEVKEKDRQKSKSAVTLRNGESKEVRFKGKTELKDLQMKAEMIKRLMERGYRVKCTAMGKEEEDLGGLLARLLPMIEDFSVVESGPRVETRQAYVIVRHVKFGASKKNSGKKISKVVETISKGVQSDVPDTAAAISSINQDEMHLQAEEGWEPVESSSEVEDEVLADQQEANVSNAPITSSKEAYTGNVNEEMAWTGFNETDDFGEVFDFDANGDTINTGFDASMGSTVVHPTPEHMDSSKPLPQKHFAASVVNGSEFNQIPPASKSVLGSLRPKPEFQKEQTDELRNPGFVSSQSDPSAVGSNRYSRGTEPKDRFHQTKSTDRNNIVTEPKVTPELSGFPSAVQRGHLNKSPGPVRSYELESQRLNQGRLPQQPPKSEIEGRGQLDLKQGPAPPGNPDLPTPSYGIFSAPKTAGSVDQKNVGVATMGKPSCPSSSTPSYGIFTAPKPAASNVQNSVGDSSMAKPDDPSLHAPSYGIFSAPKPATAGDQRSVGGATSSKASDPSSSTPSYGIFSTPKTAPSCDRRNSRDSTMAKPQNTVSSTPNSGVPGAPKMAASDQRNSIDATLGKSSNPSSPRPSYGIFSASGDQGNSGNAGIGMEESPLTKNPQNPPNSKIENPRQDIDKTREGKWGIFSREAPSLNQHKSSDNELKAQR